MDDRSIAGGEECPPTNLRGAICWRLLIPARLHASTGQKCSATVVIRLRRALADVVLAGAGVPLSLSLSFERQHHLSRLA